MGADGGYMFFKVNELMNPIVKRRIINWFLTLEFNPMPELGAPSGWGKVEKRGWSNARQEYESITTISLEDWLAKNGFKHPEDITLEFIASCWGCWMSTIKAGELPGLSEDLFRLSYGDNCLDEINELADIIKQGTFNRWKGVVYKPSFWPDCDEYYTDTKRQKRPTIWCFEEETWT